MASGKRSRQHQTHRTRNTRSSKSRLLTADPGESTQVLTNQLRSLGLYAANTLGDGNCLFRALSDQYYGSPSRHVEVRRDVCNWIERHKERYEGFVDEDEFGSGGGQNKVHEYLQRMRENATYGGHLELSAFSAMTRRNIKVIQPGLVYVIQCDSTPGSSTVPEEAEDDEEEPASAREKRKLRKERMKQAKEQADVDEEDENSEDELEDEPILYVAYHDWEHFSSIRNLKGPHAGLPCVRESPGPASSSSSEPPHSKPKPPSVKLKINMSKSRSSSLLPHSTPPTTRSPSPAAHHSRPASAISPATALHISRSQHRSPKRSFDESSEASGASSSSGGGASKRSKKSSHQSLPDVAESDNNNSDTDDDDDDAPTHSLSPPHSNSTPFLSAASSASASSSSLSSVPPSSPEPTPPPPEPTLTRRQRKKLGVPKPRHVSAGKIIIPGGRFLKNKAAAAAAAAGQNPPGEEEKGEWKTNGSGRQDVRGFRELKI